MCKILLLLALILVTIMADPQDTSLPVLFQFSQPSHTVSVFRGAALKKAISQGLVQNLGYRGSAASNEATGEDDKSSGARTGTYSAPVTVAPTPVPTPAPTTLPPSTYAPTTTSAPTTTASTTTVPTTTTAPPTSAPSYSYRTYAPAIHYSRAPTRVVYKATPIVHQRPVHYAPVPTYVAAPSYVEPSYSGEDAQYIWKYKVRDDYSNNDFGAKESRSGDFTEGQYYVRLPDTRIQTVTYTVDGDQGYIPIVEYQGQAQYQ